MENDLIERLREVSARFPAATLLYEAADALSAERERRIVTEGKIDEAWSRIDAKVAAALAGKQEDLIPIYGSKVKD
jgi:hypothetical protein